MNILIQALIIFAFTYAGDLLNAITKLPIPGSILGLILLFGSLQFKLITLEWVESVGTWLKNQMAFLFVPITVGIMVHFDLLALHWLNLVLVMVISTLVTYLVTALSANWGHRHD